MAKQVLIENIKNPGLVLVEGNTQTLPQGVLCTLEGQIGVYDEENFNKRSYPKALWENVIRNASVQEKLANRSLWGEADHPATLESSMTRVSHCMRRIWLDEATNRVMGRLDVLDTPAGRIVNTLARYGTVGISSRGSGELKMTEGKSIVDPDTYEYITHDIVVDPACAGSYPKLVMEAIARQDLDSADVKEDFGFYERIYGKLGVNLTELKNASQATLLTETAKADRVTFLENKVRELTDVIASQTTTVKESENTKLLTLLSVVEETRDCLQDRIESLVEQLQVVNTEKSKLEETIQKMVSDHENLIQKNEKQKKQFERRIMRISTTDSWIETQNKEEITRLRTQVNESKLELLKLEAEIEAKNEALRDAEKLVEKEVQSRKEMSNQLTLLKEELKTVKSQHTMLMIEKVLLTNGIKEAEMKAFMESQKMTWNLVEVRKAIPLFKLAKIEEGTKKEEAPVIEKSDLNERLSLMLNKMKGFN